MARAGQHARPTHKHCKACANHAHAPWPLFQRLDGMHRGVCRYKHAQLLVTVNGKQCFAFREKKEAEENWEMYDKLTAAV